MASHEFRTPLTTIMSTASFLEMAEGTISTSKRIARLIKIQQASRDMTSLSDDVLTFGKAEADKLEFEPDWLNISDFCGELLEEIQANAQYTHLIKLDNKMDVDEIFVDDKLIRQIMTNLITNALKYSPVGSQIELILSNDKDNFSFKIMDKGIGIPDKDQVYIFNPFHRAKNVRDISGTGLGLAITKKAVEIHQGNISFTSVSGEGTSFCVSIPLAHNGE